MECSRLRATCERRLRFPVVISPRISTFDPGNFDVSLTFHNASRVVALSELDQGELRSMRVSLCAFCYLPRPKPDESVCGEPVKLLLAKLLDWLRAGNSPWEFLLSHARTAGSYIQLNVTEQGEGEPRGVFNVYHEIPNSEDLAASRLETIKPAIPRPMFACQIHRTWRCAVCKLGGR